MPSRKTKAATAPPKRADSGVPSSRASLSPNAGRPEVDSPARNGAARFKVAEEAKASVAAPESLEKTKAGHAAPNKTDLHLPSSRARRRLGNAGRPKESSTARNGAAHGTNAVEAVRKPAALQEDGGAARQSHADKAVDSVTVPSLFDQLAELQVRRKFYIDAVNRQTNAAKALIRRYLGWRFDATEEERESVNESAARLVNGVLSGKVADHSLPDLLVMRATLEPMQSARDAIESQMKRLARELPAHPWVKSVRGFGDLALAVVVGEAGDLSKYPTKGHLWKRLGLAVHDGKAYSTWRMKGGLTAEQWTEAGYSPGRRAQIHAVLAEPLFRHQSMSAGPYREAYDRRRAHVAEAHPDWTKGHAHADALRVMTKRVLRDLWKEFRRANSRESEKVATPMPAGREAIDVLPITAARPKPPGAPSNE